MTPVLTFSLGSMPNRWFRISTIPISSTNPATMPRWSKFSTLIAEVMITSLRSGFGLASILIP